MRLPAHIPPKPIQLPVTFDGMHAYGLWGWRKVLESHIGYEQQMQQIQKAVDVLSAEDRKIYYQLK